ncbi:hypothetical protein BDZ91DRAFT_783458 [Kalaharituber pfeilii]|nr:hypothetical protein BDZ91DRAFT_783458 [Kalaharituber pfeilii]
MATYPAGAFHAYFVDRFNGNTGKRQYVLTFADSSVADFWWRLVSEDDSLKEYELCRIKPQYYAGSLKSHDGINKCLYLMGIENRHDDHNTVSNAMFVRALLATSASKYGGLNYVLPECIPVQAVPEYRSGRCYYIRSKVTPHEYWHLQHGYVQVSRTERTRFCIARALGDKGTFLAKDTMAGYETIMIPRDRIIIAVVDKNTGLLIGGICPLNELHGPLEYRQREGSENAYGSHDYTLEQLLTKQCFHVHSAGGQSLVWYSQNNVGEDWELV